jgi:hypothetical protein
MLLFSSNHPVIGFYLLEMSLKGGAALVQNYLYPRL